MRILCNGFPKHGNHALCKAVELLGVPSGGVNHLSANAVNGLPTSAFDKHLFVVRDPRNGLLSWLRNTKGGTVSTGTFLAAFRGFVAPQIMANGVFHGKTLCEEMAEYEPLLVATPVSLVVRFEELVSSDACMRHIADFLDVPYQAGAWELLPKLTKTWTGRLSDYRMLWSSDVAVAWEAEGGRELVERWGYSWNS